MITVSFKGLECTTRRKNFEANCLPCSDFNSMKGKKCIEFLSISNPYGAYFFFVLPLGSTRTFKETTRNVYSA